MPDIVTLTVRVPEAALIAALERYLTDVRPDTPKAPARRKTRTKKRRARKPGRPRKPKTPEPEGERRTGEEVQELFDRLADADVTIPILAKELGRTESAVAGLVRLKQLKARNTAELRAAVERLSCGDLW